MMHKSLAATTVLLGVATAFSAWADSTTLTISNASVTVAGDSSSALVFPISRSGDARYDAFAQYQTQDGAVLAGTDYAAAIGSLVIPAGATNATIPMTITGIDSNSPYKTSQTLLPGAGGAAMSFTSSFATRQRVTAGNFPNSVTVAYINGEGQPDLVVANDYDGTVSVLVNTNAPDAATPSVSVKKLRDEQKFRNYTVRIFTEDPSFDSNSFEILRDDKRIYAQEGGRFTVGAFNAEMEWGVMPQMTIKDSNPRKANPLAMGKDVTGDGVPDLIVSEYSGGAHCCFSVHIFEIGQKFRKIATIDGEHSQPTFVHLGRDPGFKIMVNDCTFAYWNTSFVESPLPRVILRYRDGSYQVATDLMRGPALSSAKLKKLAAKVNAAWPKSNGKDLDYDEDEAEGLRFPSDLWGTMLDLTYSGHFDVAERFLGMAWPKEAKGESQFLKDFRAQLSQSPYWSAVSQMNGFEALFSAQGSLRANALLPTTSAKARSRTAKPKALLHPGVRDRIVPGTRD